MSLDSGGKVDFQGGLYYCGTGLSKATDIDSGFSLRSSLDRCSPVAPLKASTTSTSPDTDDHSVHTALDHSTIRMTSSPISHKTSSLGVFHATAIPTETSFFETPRELQSSLSLSRTVMLSPCNFFAAGVTDALSNSEDRRGLLLEKLKEAQDMLRLQSVRLSGMETSYHESCSKLEEMKRKEETYQGKIEGLVAEAKERHAVSLKTSELDLTHRTRIMELEAALQHLFTEFRMKEADHTSRKELVEQLTSTIDLVEEENQRIHQTFGQLSSETKSSQQDARLAAMEREGLIVQLKSLNKEREEFQVKIKAAREANDSLHTEVIQLKSKVETLEGRVGGLREECTAAEIERRDLLMRDQQASEEVAAALTQITTVRAERDQAVRKASETEGQVKELERRLGALKEEVGGARRSMEDREAAVEASRREMERELGKGERLTMELAAAQKAGENLSSELVRVKRDLYDANERSHEAATAKAELLWKLERFKEQQDQSQLARNLDKELMRKLEQEKEEGKSGLTDENGKIKQQLRQLEERMHSLTAELSRSIEDVNINKKERINAEKVMEALKESSGDRLENLTRSCDKKDKEIATLSQTVSELEKQISSLKIVYESSRKKAEDHTKMREELERASVANHLLEQQISENEQVSKLMQVQRDIYARSVGEYSQKVGEMEVTVVEQKLFQGENTILKESTKRLEESLKSMTEECVEAKQTLAECRRVHQKELSSLGKENGRLSEENRIVCEKLEHTEDEIHTLASTKDVLNEARLQVRALEEKNRTMADDLSRKALAESQVSILQSKSLALQRKLQTVESEKVAADRQVRDLASRLQSTLCGAASSSVTTHHRGAVKDQGGKSLDLDSVKNEEIVGLRQALADTKEIVEKQERVIESLKEELCLGERFEKEARTQKEAAKEWERQARAQAAAVEALEKKFEEKQNLQHSLEGLSGDMYHVKSELQTLLKALEEKDTEIEKLEKKLKITTREWNDSQEHLDDLNISLSQLEQRHAASVETLEHRVHSLMEENNMIQRRGEDLENKLITEGRSDSQLLSLHEELHRAREQLAALIAQKDVSEAESAALRIQLSQLTDPTSHLSAAATPGEDILRLQDELKDAKVSIFRERKEQEIVKKANERLYASLDESSAKCKSLDHDLELICNEHERCGRDRERSDREVADLRRELDELNRFIESEREHIQEKLLNEKMALISMVEHELGSTQGEISGENEGEERVGYSSLLETLREECENEAIDDSHEEATVFNSAVIVGGSTVCGSVNVDGDSSQEAVTNIDIPDAPHSIITEDGETDAAPGSSKHKDVSLTRDQTISIYKRLKKKVRKSRRMPLQAVLPDITPHESSSENEKELIRKGSSGINDDEGDGTGLEGSDNDEIELKEAISANSGNIVWKGDPRAHIRNYTAEPHLSRISDGDEEDLMDQVEIEEDIEEDIVGGENDNSGDDPDNDTVDSNVDGKNTCNGVAGRGADGCMGAEAAAGSSMAVRRDGSEASGGDSEAGGGGDSEASGGDSEGIRPGDDEGIHPGDDKEIRPGDDLGDNNYKDDFEDGDNTNDIEDSDSPGEDGYDESIDDTTPVHV